MTTAEFTHFPPVTMMTLPRRSGKSVAGLKRVENNEPIVVLFGGTAGRIYELTCEVLHLYIGHLGSPTVSQLDPIGLNQAHADYKAQTVTKHCSLGKVHWSAECFARNVHCVRTSKDIWLLLSARIQLEVKPESAICQRRWLEINTLMENYGKIELLYIM